jgi:hypothetical protein
LYTQIKKKGVPSVYLPLYSTKTLGCPPHLKNLSSNPCLL